MLQNIEKILEEAFKLDPKDRALVVAELSSSEGIATPEEVEAAWRFHGRILGSPAEGSEPRIVPDGRLARVQARFRFQVPADATDE